MRFPRASARLNWLFAPPCEVTNACSHECLSAPFSGLLRGSNTRVCENPWEYRASARESRLSEVDQFAALPLGAVVSIREAKRSISHRQHQVTGNVFRPFVNPLSVL